MSASGKKREAVGSLGDPVLLDDSSEEDKEGKAAPRNSSAKHSPTPPHSQDNIVEFDGRRDFLLILMVRPDEECKEFLQDCKNNCVEKVHNHCFQSEDTLHFTLFEYKQPLTFQQAMAISMEPKPSTLPTMNLTGFTNWPNCVALETETSLDDIAARITPSIPHPPKNLHLSLYRLRKYPVFIEAKRQFDRVRKNATKSFGKADGVRIVLKEKGADYHGQDEGRFFRVICEPSTTTNDD